MTEDFPDPTQIRLTKRNFMPILDRFSSFLLVVATLLNYFSDLFSCPFSSHCFMADISAGPTMT